MIFVIIINIIISIIIFIIIINFNIIITIISIIVIIIIIVIVIIIIIFVLSSLLFHVLTIRTAKLVKWLHWHSVCVSEVIVISQPSLDQALVEYSQYTHCGFVAFCWKYIKLFFLEKKTCTFLVTIQIKTGFYKVSLLLISVFNDLQNILSCHWWLWFGIIDLNIKRMLRFAKCIINL